MNAEIFRLLAEDVRNHRDDEASRVPWSREWIVLGVLLVTMRSRWLRRLFWTRIG